MTAITASRRTRAKAAGAAMLFAAGAIVAGAVGAAGPANAAPDKYVAISYSPETGVYGWGNNYNDLDGARIRSLVECQNHGGNHCVWVGWAKNWCSALAADNYGHYYSWYGPTIAQAEQQTLAKNGGGRILVARCATDDMGAD